MAIEKVLTENKEVKLPGYFDSLVSDADKTSAIAAVLKGEIDLAPGNFLHVSFMGSSLQKSERETVLKNIVKMMIFGNNNQWVPFTADAYKNYREQNGGNFSPFEIDYVEELVRYKILLKNTDDSYTINHPVLYKEFAAKIESKEVVFKKIELQEKRQKDVDVVFSARDASLSGVTQADLSSPEGLGAAETQLSATRAAMKEFFAPQGRGKHIAAISVAPQVKNPAIAQVVKKRVILKEIEMLESYIEDIDDRKIQEEQLQTAKNAVVHALEVDPSPVARLIQTQGPKDVEKIKSLVEQIDSVDCGDVIKVLLWADRSSSHKAVGPLLEKGFLPDEPLPSDVAKSILTCWANSYTERSVSNRLVQAITTEEDAREILEKNRGLWDAIQEELVGLIKDPLTAEKFLMDTNYMGLSRKAQEVIAQLIVNQSMASKILREKVNLDLYHHLRRGVQVILAQRITDHAIAFTILNEKLVDTRDHRISLDDEAQATLARRLDRQQAGLILRNKLSITLAGRSYSVVSRQAKEVLSAKI